MILQPHPLNLEETLSVFYNRLYAQVQQSGKDFPTLFAEYGDPSVLEQPVRWYEALAVCEQAIEAGFNEEKTLSFFEHIFRAYDCNASIDLNETDYDWYWNKINALFDQFSHVSSEAYLEKGLQYFSARRGYVDKEKTLFYLNEAMEKGNDKARAILGYYMYYGLLDKADKEKGMELMDSVKTKEAKERVSLYKCYIAQGEGKKEEVEKYLNSIETTDPFILRMIYEQRGFQYELAQKYEEAAIENEKALSLYPAGFAMVRMGILHFNKLIEAADQELGLKYMELAFRYGRPDIIRSLYFCYTLEGEPWYDEERAMYWLQKGFEYNDGYSTYQLAWLYLYNDTYKDIEKGLYYLDQAIELKYEDAYILKGFLYYEGVQYEKNVPAYMELLQQASDLGSGNAAYRIAYLYDTGEASEEVEPDYVKALEYFELAASRNEMYAMEYAGRYYLTALGTEEADPVKAKDYYERGAALGSPYCQVELAIMYEDGNGIEEEPEKAFMYAKQAAEQEYAYGLYLLGRYYKYAIGTDENPDEALSAFQKAAEQEQVKAMAELGLCYEDGYGTEQNGVKALEYMMQAAEQGYPYAQYKTGCYYAYGLEGVPSDYAKAFEWLSKAAETDYPYALLELGDYYLYDYEGKEEYEKAYSYYERAAREGLVNEGLGVCLEYGYGVEVNEGEAFKYYLKGAEDGYIRAMYYTGLAYKYGTGVKENAPEAFRWFNDAAGHGHIGATYHKGKMLLDGEGCAQNLEEGISLLQQAAESDERNAQFDLGNCYLVGKGIEANEDLAMEWFEKAAENGHEKALKLTGRRRR